MAGVWAIYIFVFERNSQTDLTLEVSATVTTNSAAYENRNFVFLDVILANKGRRKIQAKRVRVNEIAYKDDLEELDFACGIEVKKVQSSLILTNKSLDWFQEKDKILLSPNGIPREINLLREFENADHSAPSTLGISDFWIEPNEQYHLGTSLVLESGDYLLKVHFIGDESDEEFWSRITYLHIN